jgi:hypothetical protein
MTSEKITSTPEILPDSTSETDIQPEPGFGWTPYAELINGRFAMIGFFALLILELFTREDFFTWLGLR